MPENKPTVKVVDSARVRMIEREILSCETSLRAWERTARRVANPMNPNAKVKQIKLDLVDLRAELAKLVE